MYKNLKLSEQKLNLIIFFSLIIIQLPWININGIAAPDTAGYLDVSRNWFNSDSIYIRPIIYPIFIYLSNFYFSGPFGGIIYIQIIFYALSGMLFYKILVQQQLKINRILLFFLVILSFSAPQSLHMNQIVLPEIIPLFFLLLLFSFLLKPLSLKNSLIISALIITPILIKPLWLLLLSFPIIKFIYSKKNLNDFLYGLLIPILLSISIYSTNQYLVSKNNVNQIIASTFDVNINLALIRMGLIDGSQGTKLYKYLDNNGLIPEISNRSWTSNYDEYNSFNEIKKNIPWEYREDYLFWKNILNKPTNLIKYSSFQFSRLPIFFATSAENGSVKFLFEPLNNIYQRFFSNIHSKHIAGIAFISFTLIIGLFNFNKLSIHKLLFFLILEVSIILCLLTYQNAHFLRMRASIEPLIVYVTLVTFIKLLKFIHQKYNLTIK
tara:strand:+ start:292 stop:1602 length:1311 start_codon:yes stop_codon:yes gene_type:complete